MGFQKRVLDLVAKVPEGKVVTYGQVARALDRPASLISLRAGLQR